MSQSTISVPPTPSAVLSSLIGALTVDVGAGDSYSLALGSAVPAGTSMQLWATPGVSPGVNFVKSEYRLIQVEAAASTSPVDFQAAYEAKFGIPSEGQKVFVKIVFVNNTTGQVSTPQEASTLVVST